MTVLSLDVESRSAVDIKKAGAYRYWEDRTTSLLCACYAFDDEPVQTWLPDQPCPPRIKAHVEAGGAVSAWNAAFERLAWRHALAPVHGWPTPALEQFEDTAAAGAAMGLPRALGDAAKALGLTEEKDEEGQRLMLQMARPRRRNADGTVTWWEDPEKLKRLVTYCAKDVEAERALRRVLVPLSPAEREVYLFDQRMNDRGVLIDIPLVRALLAIVDQAKAELDKRMAVATDYHVLACSQVANLTDWLRSQGVPATSLAKAALDDLLVDDMPAKARGALELRKLAAKSSTAKLNAMLACVCADGRARGLHLYHGASTGRWSGRLIQTQNMPRGTGTVRDPESAVPDMHKALAAWVELVYGSALSAVSDMLRACIRAAEGHRLLAADFSAIEGRVTAWLAGEDWKLEAFREADRGGPGIYELTAAGILDKPVGDVTKAERQALGKVPELALGFQGGVVAFHSMAQIYGVDMAVAYEPLKRTTDPETWQKALDWYEQCKRRNAFGVELMGEKAWIASEVTKVLWRKKHPETVALWHGLEDAARDAVRDPGTVYTYGKIDYVVKRGFLWCRLPSKRCLAYGAPKIQPNVWARLTGQADSERMPRVEAERLQAQGLCEILRDDKGSVTALGVDSVTKRWARFALYGGLATENCVQAVARDLMAHGLLNVERAGYPVVMTVHDEAVADVPIGFGTLDEFSSLLCELPGWAEGLPFTASGYEAQRFKKD